MNDNEVLQEMNNWEYAVKNDECGELIDNFKYIYNKNGYVRMLDTVRDDNLYFSNNELVMDDSKTKEETDIEIHELDLVMIHQGFRVFPDGKE
ncbi:19550_t:CDS:2, partial [Gigaspora rosea]